MAPLKILICGGGIAGPALAHLLVKSNQQHRIVIVERFPALRASGAQIDLRGPGIEVVKRMGLRDVIRSKCVDEAGVSFVNSKGKIVGTIHANKSGKGAQSVTSEYEIMRGDLVRIFYEATKDKVEYVFGKTVERFEQDGDGSGVVAHFSDGSEDRFDLLVGADGQGSRVRKGMLPPGEDPYRRLGVHIGYWFIPRIETDDNYMRSYYGRKGRMIFRRSHNETETQVYFTLRHDLSEVLGVARASVEEQKAFWTERFQGAGWETERFLEGLKTTENFYCQEIVQVKINKWHQGRVVLLGDAAHCPSPFSGMGTTSSLVGAYVLAGEIERNHGNLSKALEDYETAVRPFIDQIQTPSPFWLRVFIPETSFGIVIINFIVIVICFLRIPELAARFTPEGKMSWKLPDYADASSKIAVESGHNEQKEDRA